MINVLIIDDEKPARDEMEFLLNELEEINIAGIAPNGEEALKLAVKHKPDLIFLDIKMAEMNGFEVAEQLHKLGLFPGIIFTTAYDNFALKAFEISALDYILKPLDKDRIILGIEKFKLDQNKNPYDFEALNDIMNNFRKTKSPPQFISLLQGDFYKPVPLDNILCISAHGRETKIHTTSGIFLHSKCIGDMEKLLNDSKFFRCHRSYIINLEAINKIDIWFNNTYRIEMTGIEDQITVSRSYISRFRELMTIV